jgi:hypothetical protein
MVAESKTNRDKMHNVISGQNQGNKRDHLKDRINELETNRTNKNIRDIHRGIMNLIKGGDITSVSYFMYVHGVIYVSQPKILTAKP